ncbi:hypothetical protein, partial [Enterovibrio norvegicus]|uniref:hypothetical protein n=1 Tax=Enterovibrio norvegicus TaxID=188144 RepID=UPI001A7E18D8
MSAKPQWFSQQKSGLVLDRRLPLKVLQTSHQWPEKIKHPKGCLQRQKARFGYSNRLGGSFITKVFKADAKHSRKFC